MIERERRREGGIVSEERGKKRKRWKEEGERMKERNREEEG